MDEERLNEFLEHHGIKGMKWGIRRYQNEDGSLTSLGLQKLGRKNIKNSRTSNLEQWGSDSKHNILYISGYSGSGKSTTAMSLSRKGDKIIHLDAYSESDSNSTSSVRDKDFISYLDKHSPSWRKMANASESGTRGTIKRYSDKYWSYVDSFRKSIESYGELQFKLGHRVIVEGVQIADDWLSPDKKYYVGKPLIILGTNAIKSWNQASQRDGASFFYRMRHIQSTKDYVNWYISTNKRLNDLSVITDAKRGEQIVKEYLRKMK